MLNGLEKMSWTTSPKDKKIAVANLAHKTLGLLEGKSGKLVKADVKDLKTVAEAVLRMGHRHLRVSQASSPEEEPEVKNRPLKRGDQSKSPTGTGKTNGKAGRA